MGHPQKTTFTLADIAERWGCSHSTVLTLVYTGDLPAIDISTNPARRSRYVVRTDDLLAFESARTLPPVATPAARRIKVKVGDIIEIQAE